MKNYNNIKFKGTFRDYQQEVLDNASIHLCDKKIHIVAAPGSGKTILGLELIRNLNQPALVFSPSVTIRQQWGERFQEKFLPENEVITDYLSYDITKPSLITSVTYQALHAAYNKIKISEDNDSDDILEEQIPEDYSSFDLIATIKSANIKVICLDEAHHLRSEWQKALEGFINDVKNDITIIALTATPPYDSTPAEWQRYISLCGEIDDEIFVPQLVAQKTLCPHQDYIYFNYPTDEETSILQKYRNAGEETAKEIIESGLFRKLFDSTGIIDKYSTMEADIIENIEGNIALLVIANAIGIKLPSKLVKLISPRGNLPEYNIQFAQSAFQYFLDNPKKSDEKLVSELKKYLSEKGLIDKRNVCFDVSNKIKSMLISSQGKLNSINKVVQVESNNLKDNLRMLILTDYIKKEMKSLIDTDESITCLGTVPIFESIRRAVGFETKLAVLSGGLVILPESIIGAVKIISEQKDIGFTTQKLSDTGYCEVNFSGSNKNKVAVVTEAFQQGLINIMIGTKSLLGEGWDSPCINTLILASFVGSFMLSNQMRGRAIRTDRNVPDKTANIWHLVTVEPPYLYTNSFIEKAQAKIINDGETLISSDMEGLQKRFECFLAPAYSKDIIESGFSRIDIIKPPFNENGIASINKNMENISANRKEMASKWNRALDGTVNPNILEVNKVSNNIVPTEFVMLNSIKSTFWGLVSLALFVFSIAQSNGFLKFLGFALTISVLIKFAKKLRMILRYGSPEKAVKSLCKCILKTLVETGDIKTPDVKLDIDMTPDRKNVLFAIENGTTHEKNIFATASKEMMSEIDNPRYILIKQKKNKLNYVHSYTCPAIISGKKETVEILCKHLSKSSGEFISLYTRNDKGRAHVLKAREYSYVNQNCISITGKKFVKTKWQ